jgi:hypothetical protein
MGVSMLVDDINNRRVEGATPSTVEGPFHIPDSPEFGNGESMAGQRARHPAVRLGQGARCRRQAGLRARCSTCGRPDGEGLYEEQRRTTGALDARPLLLAGRRLVLDPHRRADRLHDPDGRPDRRAVRAHQHEPHAPRAHHFAISAPGYVPVTTHLFQQGDEYIDNDVVYG